MYEKFKFLFRRILPQHLLFRYETTFRSILYQIYRGTKYQCNICGKHLRRFIPLGNNEKLCPACGSLARNRRLWDLLGKEFLREGMRVLDFSPSRCIYRKLKSNSLINYISSDFVGEFMADKHYDITNIPEADESFDLVICYHILEHIEDDRKAMKELYRILKKGGHCLIQTPFNEDEIYENPSITLPEERRNHFGQADHVRIYSAQGLCDRLAACGFTAEVHGFREEANNKNGFQTLEQNIITLK
jgi:SAM-dependent methyltransferase